MTTSAQSRGWAIVCKVMAACVIGGFAVFSAVEVDAQVESVSRSERKAEERRVKQAAKEEKKALKEFEKNYQELQERHYKHQQTSHEKAGRLLAAGGARKTGDVHHALLRGYVTSPQSPSNNTEARVDVNYAFKCQEYFGALKVMCTAGLWTSQMRR